MNLSAQSKAMTFHNGSFKSIQLFIPGVMNPNLSPQSNSGISLDVGQKVYFFPKGNGGKKEILFMVDSKWENDTTLEIDQLIRIRKEEFDTKKNH